MGTRFLKVFLVAMGLVAGCGTPNNPASPQSADATVNGGRTLLGSRALQLKVDTEPTGGARLRTTHGVSQLLDFLRPDGAVQYAEVPLLDSAVPDIGFVPRGEYGGIIYRSWAAYMPGDRIEVKFTLPGTSQLVDLLVPNAGGVGYPAQGQFTVTIDVLPPEIEGYAATLVVNGNAKIHVRFVEQLRFTLGSAGAGTYAVEDTRFSPTGETTVLNRDSFSLRELKFSQETFPAFDLASGQPVDIQNSFGWSDGAPLVNPSWSVTFNDPGGPWSSKVQGSGSQFSYHLDPGAFLARGARRLRLVPAGAEELVRARADEAILTYTVRAFAQGYPTLSSSSIVPPPYEISRANQVSVAPGVRLDPPTVNPATLDPQLNVDSDPTNDVSVLFRAMAHLQGFTTPTLNWELKVFRQADPPTAQPIRTFTGGGGVVTRTVQAAAGGGGPAPTPSPTPVKAIREALIEQSWNGLDAQGRSVAQGPYRLLLSVTVTEAGGGEPRTDTATATVAVGGGTTFEIFSGNTLLADALPNILDDPSEQQRARLLKIFPYGRTGQDSTWTLRARQLLFDGDAPDTVLAKFKGDVSAVEQEVTLTRLSGTSTYEGEFELKPTLILDNDRLTQGGSPVRTTYSLADCVENDPGTPAFLNLMTGLSDILAFPTARTKLGICQAAPSPLPLQDQTSTEAENLRCFGFENVRVDLSAPGLQSPPRALVKVRHPASTFFMAAHGRHGSGETFRTEPPQEGLSFFPGRDFTVADTSALRTLVLSSCGVLDLHDYNNNYWDQESNRTAPDDPVAHRFAPGKLWFQATDQGRTILLGYNADVAVRSIDDALREFGTELTRLAGRVPPEDLQQLAWMSANFKVARKGGEVGTTCYYACAWDRSNYYYLPFVQEPADDLRRFSVRRDFGVYRIPRFDWDTEPEWQPDLPPSVAVPVPIP